MLPISTQDRRVVQFSRESWGALPIEKPYDRNVPKRIVVHHTYQPDSKSWNGPASVRAIQRYHMMSQGWSDIGYHWIVSPDGREVFACRPADAIGAHCGGTIPRGVRKIFGNTGSIGVCLAGNYDQDQPSPDGLRTLLELILQIRERHSIEAGNVLGHFEAWSRPPKTCPGKNLALALGWDLRWNRAYPER